MLAPVQNTVNRFALGNIFLELLDRYGVAKNRREDVGGGHSIQAFQYLVGVGSQVQVAEQQPEGVGLVSSSFIDDNAACVEDEGRL